MHGIVSGFKALSTWDGEKYSEILKQACGGHGFLHISGLSRIHTDFGFGFQMTEGDNTVMAQQTAKYLLKKLQTGEIDLETFEYDVKNELSMDNQLILLFEIRFKNQLKTAA